MATCVAARFGAGVSVGNAVKVAATDVACAFCWAIRVSSILAVGVAVAVAVGVSVGVAVAEGVFEGVATAVNVATTEVAKRAASDVSIASLSAVGVAVLTEVAVSVGVDVSTGDKVSVGTDVSVCARATATGFASGDVVSVAIAALGVGSLVVVAVCVGIIGASSTIFPSELSPSFSVLAKSHQSNPTTNIILITTPMPKKGERFLLSVTTTCRSPCQRNTIAVALTSVVRVRVRDVR